MNYIDYIRHALYLPNTYYRRFDLDLGPAKETVQRTLLAALPFVALYRPAGLALSLGMNGARTFTHFQNALSSQDQKDWKGCAIETGEAALAALSFAAAVSHHATALFITTGWDALHGAGASCQHLWKGEYGKAYEEALQALASAAYLSFMATGALEAMVAFAIFQGAVSLFQARHEIRQGRYLEGGAKAAMACVRINQAGQYLQQIRMRNAYLEMQRVRNLFIKILRGREAGHLMRHPLSSLKESIASKEVVLVDSQGNEARFGAHFHGNGGSLVKGENLAFRTKIIDGKEVTELDFKVNHAFRGAIDQSLQELKKVNQKEMRDILALAGSHAKGITIDSGSFIPGPSAEFFFGVGVAHKINIDGLGTILIGASDAQPSLYDRVVVRLDANRSLFELHEMLSLVDLDRALCLSTQEDIERLKMGHLFRTFFPRVATPFERKEEFFSMPLDRLKAKMIEKAPEMQKVFDTYFERMQEEHLFDGRVRYRIVGLSEAARGFGARALTAAVTGTHQDQELYERAASILRTGMIATEVKDANDFGNHGLGGGGVDYWSGGADSVYTQLLTEKNCTDQMPFHELHYQSKVRFLISLDALETGTYQYHSDSFGNRVYSPHGGWEHYDESYGKRDGILEFIRKQQAAPFVRGGHEVMLKERIAPSFFTGLIVQDEKTKTGLVNYLRDHGLIRNDSILDTPVDRFIRVGAKVTKELIAP
jgi:hypothetical protein